MTATLEEGEWSAARPGRTLPPGKTRYPFYRRLGGPQGRSGRAENLVPTRTRSRTLQPVVSRYTDWATRATNYQGSVRLIYQWVIITGLQCEKIFSSDNPERMCRTSSRRVRRYVIRLLWRMNSVNGVRSFRCAADRMYLKSASANRPASISSVHWTKS